MRRVLLNAGPIVHFGAQTSLYEEQIFAAGKGIVLEGSQIVSIQDSSDLFDEYSGVESNANPSLKIHDLGGAAVIPGLIDAHTHLLWAGPIT